MTQANRQDIVTTSQRNIGLLKAIAETFVHAVQEFCKHPDLRYTWMRFLPDARGSFFDGFWSQLVEMIKTNLDSAPVLEALGDGSTRHLIKNLRRYSDDFLNDDGNPLFRDQPPRHYISNLYQSSDMDRLQAYGLQYLAPDEILDLLEIDLKMGEESRMMWAGKEWHERTAAVLLSLVSRPEPRYLSRLRSLPILPVNGNNWVASDRGAVYFQTCASASVLIPKGLDRTLLSNGELPNSTRGQLFSRLGVVSAKVEDVRQWIVLRQLSGGLSIRLWARHLTFLYLTHGLVANPDDCGPVKVVGHDSRIYNAKTTDVYFPEDEEYSAHKLLRGELAETEAIRVLFLHDEYHLNRPSIHEEGTRTWKKWLCSHIGLRQCVPLTTNIAENSQDLSRELDFVAKHYPNKLTGFLRYNWQHSEKRIERSRELIVKMGNLQVPCEGGLSKSLSDTYLRLPDLVEICSRFLREGECFPFLKLDKPIKRGSYLRDWAFLVDTLGVGVTPDLRFYEDILITIRESHRQTYDFRKILDIYNAMYGIYAQSSDKDYIEGQLWSVLHNMHVRDEVTMARKSMQRLTD